MDLDSSFLDYANCSDQNETAPLFINLTTVSNVVIAFHATFTSLVIVTGLLANSLVLVLVAKDKRLRHRSILVGLNIVFVDILLTIFYHGVILTNCLSKGWSYNEQPGPDLICKTYGVLTTVLINIRWFAIGVLTTDRFLTVKFPFRYEKYSRRFLIVASLLTWTLPPGLASLLSLSLVSYSFRANIPTCLPSCINAKYRTACTLINTGVLTTMFIVGCIIPTGMYMWMYHKARKMRTRYTLGQLTLNVTTSVAVNMRPAQNIRSQYDRQAMVTVFLIFLTILFTSLPSYLFILLRQISVCIFFKIPVVIHFIITDIFIASTALDPVVLMKNRDFRNVIYELFHKKCLCRHHVTDGRTSSTEAEIQSSSANMNDMQLHETNLKN